MLAYALTFPRPDSYLAAQALISLGPDWTMTTAPSCSTAWSTCVPGALVCRAGPRHGRETGLLCSEKYRPVVVDSDADVRSAATLALANLTGKDLLPAGLAFTLQPFSDNPVPADTPVGSLSGLARKWWNEQGANINWHPSYDLCDP